MYPPRRSTPQSSSIRPTSNSNATRLPAVRNAQGGGGGSASRTRTSPNPRNPSPSTRTGSGGAAATARTNAAAAASSRNSRFGASGRTTSPGRGSYMSGRSGGGRSLMQNEKLVKRSQKKIRDLFRQEAKDRTTYEQERTEFSDSVYSAFDGEREQLLTKTINRLNREVSHLQSSLRDTEMSWRSRWRKVVTEVGKMNEMMHSEETLGENVITSLLGAAEDGKNYSEIAEKLSGFVKEGQEKIRKLKTDKLDQKLRGDDFEAKLDGRTSELAAADRLIRTHLVGRGSESTIAVELFRKQGVEFERRFQALEREFRSRVEDLLKDSASIEMVGHHNHEDAIISKLKLNRVLDGEVPPSSSSVSVSAAAASSQDGEGNSGGLRRTLAEENARKVEDSRAWRPSGKNFVDIYETFITSSECQKILQVQLLRDVQLAMVELSKKHFDNITSEIRKNRSNLPASVRNKLYDDRKTTRDDLIEMLDLLSFEPNVAEMIMGRFPPTELDDAAPELQRFVDGHASELAQHEVKLSQLAQQQQQQHNNSPSSSQGGAYSSKSHSPSHASRTQEAGSGRGNSESLTGVSTASIDGGDYRSAGVDLTSLSGRKERRQQLPFTESIPGQIKFPVAFGGSSSSQSRSQQQLQQQQLQNSQNPRRVNLPRRPFEVYSSRVTHARAGFSNPDEAGSDVNSNYLGSDARSNNAEEESVVSTTVASAAAH